MRSLEGVSKFTRFEGIPMKDKHSTEQADAAVEKICQLISELTPGKKPSC